MAVVSKTTRALSLVGSNPTPAALRLAAHRPPGRVPRQPPGLVQGKENQPNGDNANNDVESDDIADKSENGGKCECDCSEDSKHGGSIPHLGPVNQGPAA